MKRRKHIFYTGLVAVALIFVLAGCSKDAAPEHDPGRAIGFYCADASRALETTADNISSFRVSAVWNRTDGTVQSYMDREEVVRSGSDWTYSPIRYMPSLGTVDFFAYSPAGANVKGFNVPDAAGDPAVIAYDVTTDALLQEDFMVAGTAARTSSSVGLFFEHMLSYVEFEARSITPGSSFYVHSIELVNLDRAGTLTGTVSGSDVAWLWSDNTATAEKTAKYTVYQTGPKELDYPVGAAELPSYAPFTVSEVGALMLLPQVVTIGDNDLYTAADGVPAWQIGQPKDLDTKTYVVVTFDAQSYDAGGDPDVFVSGVKKYFPLVGSGGAAVELKSAQKYTIRLDVDYAF